MKKAIPRLLALVIAMQIVFTPGTALSKAELTVPIDETSSYSFKFKDIPRHAWGDIRETFWNKWSLLALALGAGATAGLHGLDGDTQRAFSPEDRLGKARGIFNFIGNPFVLGGGLLLSFGTSRLIDSPRYRLTAETMLEAYTFAESMTLGLKVVARRTRPDGGKYSFPSGHTSGAFAVATAIESLHGPKYGVPAYLISTMVGLSRLDANRHFLTDVVGGAVLGTIVGYGTARFHRKENPGFFISPVIANNTLALGVTRHF